MQPISFSLKPSYLYIYSLILIGVLSILSFIFIHIEILLSIIWGALITFATMFYVLRDALRQLPSAWQYIQVDNKGELALTSIGGKRLFNYYAGSSLT